jgi:hypothetical protein
VSRPARARCCYPKACAALFLGWYGLACLRSIEQGSFLDRVDLVAHEAGHLLFGYFGQFLMVAGGTLGQLLVPAGIAAYFAGRREFFSASIVLFWVGQSLLNISVYLKDAATMELPLVSVGGGESIHDWNWLLLKFNVLAYDQRIGNIVVGLGALVILASVILSLYFSFENAAQEED